VAVLIHRPPEIVPSAIDGEKHLVQMPLVAGSGTAAPEFTGIRLAELAAPLSDGFIGQDDAALGHELFNISVTQAKPKVEPHSG
jgi:hypothetical protein